MEAINDEISIGTAKDGSGWNKLESTAILCTNITRTYFACYLAEVFELVTDVTLVDAGQKEAEKGMKGCLVNYYLINERMDERYAYREGWEKLTPSSGSSSSSSSKMPVGETWVLEDMRAIWARR